MEAVVASAIVPAFAKEEANAMCASSPEGDVGSWMVVASGLRRAVENEAGVVCSGDGLSGPVHESVIETGDIFCVVVSSVKLPLMCITSDPDGSVNVIEASGENV